MGNEAGIVRDFQSTPVWVAADHSDSSSVGVHTLEELEIWFKMELMS